MSLTDPTEILAIATVVLAAATGGLVGVAVCQIRELRIHVTTFIDAIAADTKSFIDDAKKQRTLDVCNRYDSCQILYQTTIRLREARESGEFETRPKKFRVDVITLLNYLDSIAIGIAQNLFIEDMVKDHMGLVIKTHVEEYLGPENAARTGITADNFPQLAKLYEGWFAKRAELAYRGR